MPELPDVTVYVERIRALLVGHVIEGTRLGSPFLVRSFDVSIEGRTESGKPGIRKDRSECSYTPM